MVSWDAVAGAETYQVQWRWGSEAYGRVHMENGEMSSREQRVTGTSHTVAVGVPSEETLAQGLTVRVRAYDGDALTVGPWREAVLAATPGRPSGLTADGRVRDGDPARLAGAGGPRGAHPGLRHRGLGGRAGSGRRWWGTPAVRPRRMCTATSSRAASASTGCARAMRRGRAGGRTWPARRR